ncbi:MAG: dipeptide/oligopeptide/nickel ABC transporter permease/ATP-binding protein [Acidimicrobiales bacterium]
MTASRSTGARLGFIGLALLGGLVLMALAAPLLAPYDPTARVGPPFAPPGGDHLLGTNDAGQDLLSEVLFGARVSLAVGLVAALAATAAGTVVGLVAGYARGPLDAVLMRLVDVVLSLPFLPLMLVVGVFLGPGLGTQMLVIAAVMWAGPARELRSQVLSARELDHVRAARAMGGRPGHVLLRHLLPAVAPLVVPQLVLATKTAILLEASLSFLGLGDPTAKSWGTTLFYANARSAFLTDAWLWWVVPPGLCIVAAVLSLALMGYALEEGAHPPLARPAVAPRRRSRRVRPLGAPAAPIAPMAPMAPPVDLVARSADAVLSVEALSVAYATGGEPLVAVDGVSLRLGAGEVVGLVGESGSGKSTLVAAATGLLPPPAAVAAGRVRVDGVDLATLGREELRRLRGRRVALVPQQAMNALNPVFRIGDQLAEAVTVHRRVGRSEARARARELLALVEVDPDRVDDYPHQLSGGMRQRVVIAMALANDPALLVADEPTTGLDVLVQAEILALLGDLRGRLGLALLVVSHDLLVVLALCGEGADTGRPGISGTPRAPGWLVVMRHGGIVEQGPAPTVVAAPVHPYTRELLGSTPRLVLPDAPASVAR